MTVNDRTLFSELLGTLNPAPSNDDIWRGSPFDVPELHAASTKEVLVELENTDPLKISHPSGVAVLGRAGAGKTHLLGALRERIQRESLGYFFLVSLNDGRSFWPSTAIGMADGFRHDSLGWGTQHKTFFRRLTAEIGIDRHARDAVAGDAALTREHLDTFIKALRTHNPDVGRDCQHTARALVLQGSANFDDQDVGDLYLQSQVVDESARSTWGLPASARTPQEIIRDISRLIALTRSPSVIAFDQLDLLFEHAVTASFSASGEPADPSALQAASVAQGLVDLREKATRTLIVLSCLPDTWTLLSNSAPTPFVERFRVTKLNEHIVDAALGRKLIAVRFKPIFKAHKIEKESTWPVKAAAFTQPLELSPRQLLRRVVAHIEHGLVSDTFEPLAQLQQPTTTTTADVVDIADADFEKLDRRFAELVGDADIADALEPRLEDERMSQLLTAGLEAWIAEQQSPGRYKLDIQHSSQPSVHARLIEVLDEDHEREATWCFRAIASPTANAVISRIRKAVTKSGIDSGLPNRHLILLRNSGWPSGKRTDEVTEDAVAAGALVQAVADSDLRVFAALKELNDSQEPLLREWLGSRQPASGTQLLQTVLGGATDAVTSANGRTGNTPPGQRNPGKPQTSRVGVYLGKRASDGEPFAPELASLRKHTVLFAGSGSGKTVLVRRLVEECARQGVSSIVLDPNNDLARLGEAWPEPPNEGWEPDDARRAADYLANTDVVVWTPRINAGRPLSFQPMPDFGPVLDSIDELSFAIESAVEALANRVGASGKTEKAKKRKAVLTEAMRAYATSGTTSLAAFADYLENLPQGASKLANGQKLANEIAEALKAEMITNPLLGGQGASADPGALLTPAPGKRARVSVISLVGLTSLEQQQGFVNQLQMALFSWIKQHPAVDRPLGGLLVMDEAQNFAPVSGGTPSTMSTIWLAQQARKYGLGLVFATQAPKGIHNQISGNATTQFFGRLNVPVQIAAAKEVAAAKGASVSDIGTLTRGQFYAVNDETLFVRVNTPLCLSYHGSPLTREEVISRAITSFGPT